MKLVEMKTRPRSAGLARLKYRRLDIQRREFPFRVGDEITLPSNPEVEYFHLRDGQQFLLRWPCTSGRYGGELGIVWFGGTDERPFLVSLYEESFDVFREKGEHAFYDSLKPSLVARLEEILGVAAKRQGDIFAVPLSLTWDQVRLLGAFFALFGGLVIVSTGAMFRVWNSAPEVVSSGAVFGTRHRLTGKCTEQSEILADTDNGVTSHIMLAEGTLRAPDHSPAKLVGVHLLSQTRFLTDPSLAD